MIVSQSKVNEARVALELVDEELTELSINQAFRRMSKLCHPNGGRHDPAMWQRITWAKELLLKVADGLHQPTEGAIGACRACAGKGRIQKRSGFGPGVSMMCVMCDGTGSPKQGHDRDV